MTSKSGIGEPARPRDSLDPPRIRLLPAAWTRVDLRKTRWTLGVPRARGKPRPRRARSPATPDWAMNPAALSHSEVDGPGALLVHGE